MPGQIDPEQSLYTMTAQYSNRYFSPCSYPEDIFDISIVNENAGAEMGVHFFLGL